MTLKLGPLPRTDTVKVTLTVPVTLKEQLDAYAALHSRLYGEPVDGTALAPHILALFLSRDRVFRKAIKEDKS